MAGKHGSTSVTVTLEDSPGGTARTITSGMQESTAYGDTFKKQLPTGVKEIAQITMSGFWDTTATTGSHVVFGTPDDGPQDDTRELVIVFGDSKTFTADCYLVSYEVMASPGSLTKFTAVLQVNSGVWS